MSTDNNNRRLLMEPGKLRTLEKFLRKELRRHFLSERERIVAEVLLETSLGWGMRNVRVPVLDDLAGMTGIARPHVHGALRALVEMRIVSAADKEGMTEYTINANPELWKVKIRVPRATIKASMERIKAANGMDDADPEAALGEELQTKCAKCKGAPENFRDCPGAGIFACEVTDSETVTDNTPFLPNLI